MFPAQATRWRCLSRTAGAAPRPKSEEMNEFARIWSRDSTADIPTCAIKAEKQPRAATDNPAYLATVTVVGPEPQVSR